MQKLFIASLIVFSSSVFAGKIPIRKNEGPVVPVSEMTCAQAKAYAFTYGYYWKIANGKDLIPIYPIYESPYDVGCNGKNSLFYIMEQTSDEAHCHLTYTCGKV